MRYAVAILVLMTLLVTGCAKSSAFTYTELTYTLTGGIAGFDTQIHMEPNGAYRLSEKGKATKTGTLSKEQVAKLEGLLSQVDWPSIQPEYKDPRVADSLFEGVLVKGVAGKEYATVVGTGGTAPAPLMNLLAELQKVLKEQQR